MLEPLLDSALLKKLERLALASRRAFAGQMKGDKRSVKRGSSVEFADYREYLLGDDLRYVDWNTAARLERLFVKLFIEEEDLFVALLVDTSASMGFGSPTKLRTAAQIAGAIGYVGLVNYDRVSLSVFAGPAHPPLPSMRGRVGARALLDALAKLHADGSEPFAGTLRAFAAGARSQGVAVVLSDFLATDWEDGLRALLARGFQVVMVQTLADEEIEPTIVGDVRLLDSETGESREMSVNPALLGRYREAVREHQEALRAFASRFGLDFLLVTTSMSVEDVVLRRLRPTGLVR